jgi:Ca2+-binding RTX toxin-like protein
MSRNENKAYQFTVVNGQVSAVFEIKNGRAKLKAMESDESYVVEGSSIIKREYDDGRIEKTIYTDDNGDGFYIKVSETYEPYSAAQGLSLSLGTLNASQPATPTGVSDASLSGYRFAISGDQVTAVYELERGYQKQERIDSHETWIIQAGQVIKTEQEHGVIETTVYADVDGDGVFQKVAKDYGLTDGTTTHWLADNQHGDDGDNRWEGGRDDDAYHGGSSRDSLRGGDGSDDLYGGDDDDSLSGGIGNDDLDGGHANDTLYGDSGDDHLVADSDLDYDLYIGGAGKDILDFSASLGPVVASLATGLVQQQIGGVAVNDKVQSVEVLVGSGFADKLNGSSSSDELSGGQGNDSISGGRGSDVLTGGEGDDVFVYTFAYESGLTTQTRDVITDFAEGDLIDLSAIDARSGNSTNDAFSFIGSVANLSLANANGALWFDQGVLYGSTDADLAPEFSIELVGVTHFELTDFVG